MEGAKKTLKPRKIEVSRKFGHIIVVSHVLKCSKLNF
jgi:hypothetical protein